MSMAECREILQLITTDVVVVSVLLDDIGRFYSITVGDSEAHESRKSFHHCLVSYLTR